MPWAATSPNGADRCLSSTLLSAVLMKNCVDRELGARVFANVTNPRLLLSLTASSAIVVVPTSHQVVEPIGTERRPRAVDRHDERPLAGLELRLERVGRLLGERGRVLQLREIDRPLSGQRQGDGYQHDRRQQARHVISWSFPV